MTEAERLLLHIYNTQGPRDKRGKIYPLTRYARMSLAKVNETWDFGGRMLMHEIATVLAPKLRKTKR